jgi:hypothetical protein
MKDSIKYIGVNLDRKMGGQAKIKVMRINDNATKNPMTKITESDK